MKSNERYCKIDRNKLLTNNVNNSPSESIQRKHENVEFDKNYCHDNYIEDEKDTHNGEIYKEIIVIDKDGTFSDNGPVVLSISDKQRIGALSEQFVQQWQHSSHLRRRSDIKFTVASNDKLTESKYRCQTLYKAAFNHKMDVEETQAIVCGWLPNISEPVCACRLTMHKSDHEYLDECDCYPRNDEKTNDETSQDTKFEVISIDNFAVHPSYHRGGIGSALMYHVKEWALYNSYGLMKRLWLVVDYEMSENCNFYSKLGFVIDTFDDDDSGVNMSFMYEDDPDLRRL